MKTLICFWLLTLSLSASAIQNLVLVPGFFSSAIPAPNHGGNPWEQPYFSQDIVDTLNRSGNFRVWVTDTLDPLGSVESNGRRLITFLQFHASEMAGDPILLIGHSAGGLYSLYAAANSDFPIQQIIAIATPFQGLKFLETLQDRNVAVDSISHSFCLENLLGLRQQAVQNYLSQLHLKKLKRLDVFAGYQKPGFKFWDWRTLSQPLASLQFLNREKSDGVVTVSSALGAGVLRNANAYLDLQIHSEPFNLEHFEFAWDADLSIAFGVCNRGSLRRAQESTYIDILSQSGL